MYNRFPSLVSAFLRRVSARGPVLVRATTWTVLLMFTVSVASFVPELAFISTVTYSCGGGKEFVRIPLEFSGESVCVPSRMVKNSGFDFVLPTVFAAVMVTTSAFLLRSCLGTDYVEHEL